MTEQEALLVLNAIPGMSGEAIRRLMGTFGNAQRVLQQQEENFLNLGLSQNLVTNIVHFPKDKFLEGEYNYLRKSDIKILSVFDEDYPSLLKQIKHAPLVLYIKGNLKLLNSSSVALVGSRKASSYGLKIAEEFGFSLSQAGMTVVSGGAYGIDTVSHKGALKANGGTIAVLGCGLNHVYPKENAKLFEDIAQKGLLVSEFPMDTAPLAYNFPRRNRIVSGLSLATVVIEAGEKSGALITADFALEQNREVFAVPGNIDSIYSQGSNRLIKEGSKIALSSKEVLEELGVEIKNQLANEIIDEKEKIHLSEEEYKIYELIDQNPSHIDIISSRCGQGIGLLMGCMLNLELKGVVKQLPGQYYIRV